MSLPEPNFIDRDPQTITAEIVAQYESLTGKTLYPAQVERLLIDVMAYRETMVRIGIQEAAKQCLVAYARAPMLDYLGELVGVTRLPTQPAKTRLHFALEASLATDILIPAGTRVEGGDAALIFSTDEPVVLQTGQLFIDVAATCETPGVVGNGWQPGQMNSLVDALSDIDITVQNTGVTNGGFDEENDERLRERIRLAPEAFSTAGSQLAYIFHAKSAHQSIVDVAVLSPTPGVVKLYPLLNTGLPDANKLALVEATCSADRIRPLTDQVKALAPTPIDYTIDAQVVLYTHVDIESVKAQAHAAASAYVAERAAGLGRDVVPSQVIAALQVAGVYQVILRSPAALIMLQANEWARCTTTTLDITGLAHG